MKTLFFTDFLYIHFIEQYSMSKEIIERVEKILPDFELKLVSQGAEALVFVTEKHPYLPKDIKPAGLTNVNNYIVKYRPRKPYRHEQLDLQITKSRTAGEAKLLYKLDSLNIKAPKLIALDAINGIIWMEFLGFRLPNGDFSSLKNWLWFIEKKGESEAIGQLAKDVMRLVGYAIAELHLNEIVHGDLTSSNIVLVKESETEEKYSVALIDFGLSSYSNLVEDKAVDIYVLERALVSTHPQFSELYNEWLLEGYHSLYSEKKKINAWRDVERRLAAVRLRGRKRSMLG